MSDCTKYRQDPVKKTFINRYCKQTGDIVIRIEPSSLEEVKQQVWPRRVELFDGYLNKYLLGHIVNDRDIKDERMFRNGDYVIIDGNNGFVDVINAEAMLILCDIHGVTFHYEEDFAKRKLIQKPGLG